MRIVQVVAVFALCVSLVFIAVAALAISYYIFIISSGPYSDAQLVAKTTEPIEHVQVSMTAGFTMSWKVDARFILDCGDGVAIRQGTELAELSKKWGANSVVKNDYASSGESQYFVYDNVGDSRRIFMILDVNNGGVVVDVHVFCDRKKGVKMLDLQSSREIGLYDSNYDLLVSFFQSLPR